MFDTFAFDAIMALAHRTRQRDNAVANQRGLSRDKSWIASNFVESVLRPIVGTYQAKKFFFKCGILSSHLLFLIPLSL